MPVDYREVRSLQGVKFLSLNNRSNVGCNLNPERLEVVDAVLRDLEVIRLLKEPVVVSVESQSSLATEAEVVNTPENDNWPEKRVNTAKIPFQACLQYTDLQSSTDLIYSLIRSAQNSDSSSNISTNLTSTEVSSASKSTINDNLEINQARKLAELSEWRQQLMSKLSSYDINGTVIS